MSSPPRRLVHDPEGLNTAVWPMCADRLVTPVEAFFTRSHAPTPAIDSAIWRLEIDGLVDRPATFSLAELADAFPRQEVAATLMCAGLRRDEFLTIGPLPGDCPGVPSRSALGSGPATR
jgi:sulfite oxidase